MKFQLSFPAIAFAALATAPLHAQDFVNGDLETGRPSTASVNTYPTSWDQFSTWDQNTQPFPTTTTPDWIYLDINNDAVLSLEADSLSPFADPNYPTGFRTGISQEVDGFSIGQSYVLSFEAAYVEALIGPSIEINSNVGSINVYMDGVLVTNFAPGSTTFIAGGSSATILDPLELFSYQFTATGTIHTFGFQALETGVNPEADQNQAMVFVDDFRITAVPEAGTTILLLGTALGLALRRRRMI